MKVRHRHSGPNRCVAAPHAFRSAWRVVVQELLGPLGLEQKSVDVLAGFDVPIRYAGSLSCERHPLQVDGAGLGLVEDDMTLRSQGETQVGVLVEAGSEALVESTSRSKS